MKYVVIADLHVQYKGLGFKVEDLPLYIYYPLLNLRKAAEYAKKENATLIIAGDLIEEKSRIHQLVLTKLTEALYECNELLQGSMYILAGNHDYIKIDDKPVSFLDSLYGLNVIKPEQYEQLDDLALVSYGSSQTIRENFSQLDFHTVKLIVSHFGIQEAIVGYTRGIGEFSLKDFKGMEDKFLVLGHYHKPQEVAKNIIYVGSPYIVRYDERDDEKRFIVFDTDTMTYKSIKTEYPKFKAVNASDVQVEEIANEIENSFTTFTIEVEGEVPLHIKDLQDKYPGFVFVKQTVSETENKQEITPATVSFKNILTQYLEGKGVPQEKFNHYLEVISDII